MLTVASLVKSLKEGQDRVHVQLEYGPEKKGESTELGVRFRVCPPGKYGEDCNYTSLHFHYATKQSTIKDASPEISAHFKVGQGKAAPQGHELPVYDAYALYLLICALKPTKGGWSEFKVRVTEKKINELIKQDDLRQLRMVFASKVFDLSFWEIEAWNKFLDWQTS
jgi:hypothetical protein